MAKRSNRTFVRGSARLKEFSNGGHVINVSLNVDDLTSWADEKGYVPIVIAERGEVDEYNNTHYMYIDEYSIERRKERMQQQNQGTGSGSSTGSRRENPFK